MKLLYVEDDLAHVALTQRTLEEHFSQEVDLFHAKTIASAFQYLETTPDIDLVFVDLHLPDGNGLDLLKVIRERVNPPPVILVTGQGDEQSAVAALKAGAVDYLVKQSDYLLRLPVIITNAISRSKLLQEQVTLRDTEIRYQSLVEHNPAVVFLDLADETETNIYISPRIQELMGYSVDEWHTTPGIWNKSLHSADRERIQTAYDKSHNENLPFKDEYRLIRKDGSVVWVKESTNLIFDESGKPKYWQGILLDITAEKESQMAVVESQERFLKVFHSSPVATCVASLVDGRFLDANQAFLDLTGYPLENLLGHTSVELGFWEDQTDREVFTKDLKANQSTQGRDVHFNHLPAGPKDTIAYYELLEIDGKPYVLAMFYDVTEQKRSQHALQIERDFALQVLNNMGQGLSVTNTESLFEYVNPAYARMLGYSLDEVLGKVPADFTAKEYLSSLQTERERRQRGEISMYESSLLHKDGHQVPVMVTGVPRKDGEKVTGTIAVITDLTAIKQAETSLERQVKELSLLHSIAIAGAESTSENEIVTKTIEILHQIYKEVCGILLVSETGDILKPHPSYRGADVTHWLDGYPVIEGLAGQAVLQGVPIRLGNVTQHTSYVSINSTTRSELCVPIWVHERVIGVVNVESQVEDAFDEKDERFLTTVAGTLGASLEKARLYQTELVRHEQADNLREATNLLSTTLDSGQLFETILNSLMTLIQYDSASIFIETNEGDMEIVAVRGLPNNLVGRKISSDAKWHQLAASRSYLIIADAQLDSRFVKIPESGHIHGWMGVPMVTRERVIGFINVDSRQLNRFTEQDATLVQIFANSAAIALENVNFYEETQQRLWELEIINQVSTIMRTAQSPESALPTLLDKTLELINTPHGSIWLYDRATGFLTQRVASGAENSIKHKAIHPGEGIIGKVFQTGRMYTSVEFKNDPLLWEENRESLEAGLGGVCIPIQSTAGTVGVLLVVVETGREIKAELNLLSILTEITGNAIHRAELFEKSHEQVRRLTTLRDIDSAIASSTDLRVTLKILTNQAIRHLNVDATDILLYRPELHSLSLFASAGFNTPSPTRPLVRLSEGLAGQAVMKGRSEHIADLRKLNQTKVDPLLLREGFVSYISVPLMIKGQIKGLFEVFQRSEFAPTAEWMQFLHTLAGQAAIAIDNAQLFENLQRSNQELLQAYDTTLEGWAKALELRDRETEGHSRRVTEMTMRLAKHLGVHDEQMVNIYRGVLLHDIGKMGVPDHILKKTGPLTDDEWAEMRKHPQHAYDLISPIGYLRPVLDIPYCHHEHWDGSGYPRGLKGEQIPLAARIFAVVDKWDALLSDRPYRPAWRHEKVMLYLRSIAGSVLDPKIVDAFLDLLGENATEE